MYYGARYYDPALARFIQPDTIVPSPMDPQSLNRYSYVRNNPINLVDPTGHEDCAPEDDWCWENRWYEAQGYCWSDRTQDWTKQCKPEAQDPGILEEIYGVTVDGDWAQSELNDLINALYTVVHAFYDVVGYDRAMTAFQNTWGGTSFLRCHIGSQGCEDIQDPNYRGDALFGAVIRLFDATWSPGWSPVNGIIHEMGHIWDERVNFELSRGMAGYIGASPKGCLQNCAWQITPRDYLGGLYRRPPNAVEDFADSFMQFVTQYNAGAVDSMNLDLNLRNQYMYWEIRATRGALYGGCAAGFVYMNPLRCP